MINSFSVEIEAEVYDILTQQYEVGLYVAVYQKGRIVDQFGTQATAEEFYKEMESSIVPKKEGE